MCKRKKKSNILVPESIPGSCELILIPPNGVLGLGLGSGGKALAGDRGLLRAELSDVWKLCML